QLTLRVTEITGEHGEPHSRFRGHQLVQYRTRPVDHRIARNIVSKPPRRLDPLCHFRPAYKSLAGERILALCLGSLRSFRGMSIDRPGNVRELASEEVGLPRPRRAKGDVRFAPR